MTAITTKRNLVQRTGRIAFAMAVATGAASAARPVFAQPVAGAERGDANVGAWQTWVLTAGNQFRLPPPPDAAATRAELEQLRSLAASRDAEALARIAWWDAAAPSYRWGQIAVEEALRANLNTNFASHHLALMHTALADAMVAAWDSKYAHNRPRPAASDSTLRTAAATPANPSYPDEHAVAGAVAAAMLGHVMPQRAAEFARLAEEEGRLRVVAGVAYPSDVAAGTALGRQVAAVALERARRDRSDLPWTGTVPTGPGLWTGTPIVPQAATWMPWLLTAPNEFRPAAPPAYNSPERAAELADLRAFQRTPKSNADALFVEYATAGARGYQYWNGHLGRLLLEYGQATDAPRAARAYALLNAAYLDAVVACWDAKYSYWTMRPSQLDPEFRPVFNSANHPSFPSANSCVAGTWTTVLAHLFPRDAAALAALAREAGEGRFAGGIHYRSDLVAGEQIAAGVADRAIARARADGGDAPTMR